LSDLVDNIIFSLIL